MAEKKSNASIKYVYPEHLRDLYVNGLWGGFTPRHEMYIHFFSQRNALPKTATHEIQDGKLGKEVSLETGGDLVRLVQASIILDKSTALAFRDWLNEMIAQMTEKKEDKK